MRHLSCGGSRRLTTMLDYAQIQIFHAVTTCGCYQGCLLLIFILHNVMHAIIRTLPVGDMPSPKWPPHGNRRRAPGVIRLRIQWLWLEPVNPRQITPGALRRLTWGGHFACPPSGWDDTDR